MYDEGNKGMQEAASATKTSVSRQRNKMFTVVIVLLVIMSCSLAVGGNFLMAQQRADGEPLQYPPNHILPRPDIEDRFNTSLSGGAAINESIRIAYDSTYGYPTFVFSKGELLIQTPPIEYDVVHWQRWYVFIGFIFFTNGIINWTIYDPTGSVIAKERFDNLASATVYCWYLLEANGDGTYLLAMNNMNQSQFDITISLGFSVTYWSRPYFYVGAVAVVLAAIGGASLAILTIHHGKRIAPVEAS